MIVTKWYRDIGDGMEFNHISTGFNPDHEEPAWVSEEQRKLWLNSLWIPQEAELINGVLTGGSFAAQLQTPHSGTASRLVSRRRRT